MKSKEELEKIKIEWECLRKKLSELTIEELKQINGGFFKMEPKPEPCPIGIRKINVEHGHEKCWRNKCGLVTKVGKDQFCNWYMQNIGKEF